MKDDQLDALLNSRPYARARTELAESIIRAAQRIPQRRRIDVFAVLSDMLAEFNITRPVSAFASVLVLGLVLGIELMPASETQTISTTGTNVMAGLLDSSEDTL